MGDYVKSQLIQSSSDGDIYLDENGVVYLAEANTIKIIGYLNSEGQVVAIEDD